MRRSHNWVSVVLVEGYANMAELADAPRSARGGLKAVRVRLPLFAPGCTRLRFRPARWGGNRATEVTLSNGSSPALEAGCAGSTPAEIHGHKSTTAGACGRPWIRGKRVRIPPAALFSKTRDLASFGVSSSTKGPELVSTWRGMLHQRVGGSRSALTNRDVMSANDNALAVAA